MDSMCILPRCPYLRDSHIWRPSLLALVRQFKTENELEEMEHTDSVSSKVE